MPVKSLEARTERALKTLRQLVDCRGVSGDEFEVRAKLKELAIPLCDEWHVDALGNLICVKRGSDPTAPRVMLTAHMDEVGLMITGINENGTLRFTPVGSVDARVLVSKSVFVGDDKLQGVIGAKPIHLQEAGEQTKPLKTRQMFIDIGVSDKKSAEALVSVGDYVVFDGRYIEFGDGLVKSKALDDRVGCTMLLNALEKQYPSTVIAVFTTQEEIGLRGARVAAYAVHPDYDLNFEGTTCADMPGVDDALKVTRLGKGCALTMMDRSAIPHKGLRDFVVKTANENNIPWQWRAGVFGGTDLGAIHLSREGIPAMGLATPCRYIHSASPVMHTADFEANLRLMDACLSNIHHFHAQQGGKNHE